MRYLSEIALDKQETKMAVLFKRALPLLIQKDRQENHQQHLQQHQHPL
jgi:hypothetical protein